MHSRISVGPRILRNSRINRIFLCKLPTENHLAPYITKKGQNNAKYMEFHKNYVCEEDQHAKPFQKLWYIKCYGWSSPRKALAILSDITVRRYAVDPEDLKPYWKTEKRPQFSR